MILLLQFLLAHLIGDFLFQPGKWVRSKFAKKGKSPYLYLHIAVHFVLLLMITGGFEYWLQALVIVVIHGFIDLAKLTFQKDKSSQLWFFSDQAAHLLTILLVWYFFNQPEIVLPELSFAFWVIVTSAVLLTKPAAFAITELMSPWSKMLKEVNDDALPDAGHYIGILERLLSFAFIAIGQWPAIGFLLAAKSIFRFGDLTRAKDRRLTEYILIGTLLSFGMAIAVGLMCSALGVF